MKKEKEVNKKFGLGKGIGSIICALISVVLSIVTIYTSANIPILCILFMLVALILAITSLILGILAIKAYNFTKKNIGVKSKATLILGIIGCVLFAGEIALIAVAGYVLFIISLFVALAKGLAGA